MRLDARNGRTWGRHSGHGDHRTLVPSHLVAASFSHEIVLTGDCTILLVAICAHTHLSFACFIKLCIVLLVYVVTGVHNLNLVRRYAAEGFSFLSCQV